jgi:hypothetical protein
MTDSTNHLGGGDVERCITHPLIIWIGNSAGGARSNEDKKYMTIFHIVSTNTKPDDI